MHTRLHALSNFSMTQYACAPPRAHSDAALQPGRLLLRPAAAHRFRRRLHAEGAHLHTCCLKLHMDKTFTQCTISASLTLMTAMLIISNNC